MKTDSQKRRINRREKILKNTKELLSGYGEEGLALVDIALEMDEKRNRVGNILSFYCSQNDDMSKTVIKRNGRWVSSYAMETVLYTCDNKDGNGEEHEP